MEQFFQRVAEAGRAGNFRLPEAFLYSGLNPLSLRSVIVQGLDAQDKDEAISLLYLGLAVNLTGTKLAERATNHPKYSKQGEGTKNLVIESTRLHSQRQAANSAARSAGRGRRASAQHNVPQQIVLGSEVGQGTGTSKVLKSTTFTRTCKVPRRYLDPSMYLHSGPSCLYYMVFGVS